MKHDDDDHIVILSVIFDLAKKEGQYPGLSKEDTDVQQMKTYHDGINE